jgi:hypothetical protein
VHRVQTHDSGNVFQMEHFFHLPGHKVIYVLIHFPQEDLRDLALPVQIF